MAHKIWVKIPDVLFFQEGPGVRNTQYTNDGVKLLNVANLVDGKVDLSTSDRYISESEAYGKYSHFLCDEGDFIVASSGIKVEYIDKKMGFIDKSMLPLCMNTSTIRFKVLNPNELRIRYFMYYLKSQHFKGQLFKQITGSAQLNYGPSHLKKMDLPLIDIGEQDIIIERLDKLQRIIDYRQEEINKLDELIKARFVEMFGDPEINDKKWDEACIGDNCFVTKLAGFEYTNYIHYQESGDVVMVKAQNVKNGKLNRKDLSFISNEVSDSLPRSQLAPGDVVMTYVGANIGDVAIIDDEYKYHLAPNVAKIRPNAEIYNSIFFMHLLMMKTDYIMRNSADTAKAALGMERIRKLKVFVPDIALQIEFSNFAKQVDKSKSVVQKSLDEAQLLFDSLMREYFG